MSLQNLRDAHSKVGPLKTSLPKIRLFGSASMDVLDIVTETTEAVQVAAAPATLGVTLATAIMTWLASQGIDLVVDSVLVWTEKKMDSHIKQLQEFNEMIFKEVTQMQLTLAETADDIQYIQMQIQEQRRQQALMLQQQNTYIQKNEQSTQKPQQRQSPPSARFQERAQASQLKGQLTRFSKNKIVAKFGFMRSIAQSGLDFIPLVELWPWRTLGSPWKIGSDGVWGRDRQYKKMYHQVMADYEAAVRFLQLAEVKIAKMQQEFQQVA